MQLYNDVPVLEEQATKQRPNPWLLRLEFDRDKMGAKGLRMSMIDKKLTETFAEQISIMVSDDNSDKHVLRIRLNNVVDDEETTVASFLKNEFEPALLYELPLKGLPEITKVTFTKNQETSVDPKSGAIVSTDDSWVIETDGSALAKVLTIPSVDATRTISNDTNEVLKVLGIEAARQSLINETRFVFSSYGIYVNYRHLTTLVDMMSLRGRLTSITRTGINRVDSGVLRKCTFEETVEILLEGSVLAEKDCLLGVSENVIMGQMAPVGTGSFGVSLDPQVIEEHAKSSFGLQGVLEMISEMGDDQGSTPMPIQEGNLTPTVGMTPSLNGLATPGSFYPMTPSGALFSPKPEGGVGGFDSPGYQSPSPGYVGANVASPGYTSGYQFASPVYNQGVKQSPNYHQRQQSPAYLASATYAKPGQTNQNVGNGGYMAPYSPVYAAQSPMYSNNPSLMPTVQAGSGAVHLNQNQSPSYSPSGMNMMSSNNAGSHQKIGNSLYSPSYSPNSLNKNGISGVKSADVGAHSPYYGGGNSASPVMKFEVGGNQSAQPGPGKPLVAAFNPGVTNFGEPLNQSAKHIKEEAHESDSD